MVTMETMEGKIRMAIPIIRYNERREGWHRRLRHPHNNLSSEQHPHNNLSKHTSSTSAHAMPCFTIHAMHDMTSMPSHLSWSLFWRFSVELLIFLLFRFKASFVKCYLSLSFPSSEWEVWCRFLKKRTTYSFSSWFGFMCLSDNTGTNVLEAILMMMELGVSAPVGGRRLVVAKLG